MGKTRTSWELCLTVGIPFSRWGDKPFILHPIPFPTDILESLAAANQEESNVPEPRIHPFLLARSWQQQLDDDTGLTKAKIAAREGISCARVTQVMNLLQLPAEIQAGLLTPPCPLEIHSFTERSLRVLVSCGDEEVQMSRWRNLVQDLTISAGK
jgi:ParB-like chromosome segregation protein Spo0J